MSNKSRFRTLNPFLDKDGLIRVGGRLSKSSLAESQKFPIVLPSNHRTTEMIFVHEHRRLLHIGPQDLLSNIQAKFWPLRDRHLARTTVHRCIVCFRYRPTTLQPIMAPLPRARITAERPFLHTGVDFCGPIYIRSGLKRVTSTKAYISVFVCIRA